MSEVKRWDLHRVYGANAEITATMLSSRNGGKYVLASDYDRDVQRLLGEIAGLRDRKNSIVALLEERDRQYVITGDYIAKCQKLADERDALAAENKRLREAFLNIRNVAAGYSNFCEENASTRRLEREFEASDKLYRSIDAATVGSKEPTK